MLEKKYKTKINEDAAKRFRMLCEYSFNITEDDGEEFEDTSEEPQNNDIPMSDNSQNNNMGGDDMGNNDMSGNSMNNENPSEQNGAMGDVNIDGNSGGAPGFNPETNDGNMDMSSDGESMGMDTMQSDDEVIDVDDLTKSQEETEEKVEDINVSMEKGFGKLLKIIDKLGKMIDNNTENMEQIKQEIEKRNPTPLEKLNMRAANDSYPFNVSPNEYWTQKEANSHYRIGGENEPDSEQYTITQNDIDNITDFQKISKELDSSEFNQNLMNIFGLR